MKEIMTGKIDGSLCGLIKIGKTRKSINMDDKNYVFFKKTKTKQVFDFSENIRPTNV